ncbi:MAG TPA: head-tail connector protein [Acidimicrobiales bacterium]|nr:head-tail connector protein [Acidimicrobiales bacterium]
MPLPTLADVKTYLNIRSTTNDAELQSFLDDAIAAVEDVIGPITPVSVTDVYDRHGTVIVLSQTPVQSVQSVSVQPWLGAAPIDDTAAWLVNPRTGVLRRQIVGGTLPWVGPGSVFTVTYTVGRDSVPGPVNRAILIQVRDMWRSQRGAMPTPAADQPQEYGAFGGFLSPAVMELLARYLPPPGVA